ncbi:MAG: GNAT family N-acetyltransferase, partial [Erysipelotrichaceae bacterium]|nr:GNAT family N-acetyltransferase [Erysipelotrichaceae bacterium]
MIEYRTFGAEQAAAVREIYEANRWSSYLGDPGRIEKALAQSLYTLGAFDGGRLVGFVRCVGDTEFILYVQDVIVLPAYQRRGIGRELMRRTSEAFPAVRQF